MRKRRIKARPRFWVILAIFIIVMVSLVGGCRKDEETAKASACEVVVEDKDYILDIPLTCDLQEELYKASEEFGVDYYVMIALIDRETTFRNVHGDSGASYGYCQIQPRWWYGLMLDIGATDLMIPKDNFRTACAIIAQLTEKYQSVEGALVAYNQGYYNGSSTAYSREIIANAERYRA